MPILNSTEIEIRKYLGFSDKEWGSLFGTSLVNQLREIISILMKLDNELSDLAWFLSKLHEEVPSESANAYLNAVRNYKGVIYKVVMHERDDYTYIDDTLKHSIPVLNKLLKTLVNYQYTISNKIQKEIRTATIVDSTKKFWKFLDKVWANVEETVIDALLEILHDGKLTIDVQRGILTNAKPAKNVLAKLSYVRGKLREQVELRQVENLDFAIDELKLHERFANGLLPCSVINGNMHVSVDDCPRLSFPQYFTRVTPDFAYCILNEDKKVKCPGFDCSQGSYVVCNQVGMEKLAGAFFKDIREADDSLYQQFDELAKDDHNIHLMKLWSERRDGKLFYAPVLDLRIFDLLSSYPHTKRAGKFNYNVYIINNEPVFASRDIFVSANKDLLNYLDKGDSMPKIAMLKSAAVMRLTFTSNARLDPNFRDYMRKMKAKKITDNTWDVPYMKEDDIERIKAELRDDFGYPISIFQLIESPEVSTDGRRYDIYAMTCVAGAVIAKDRISFNKNRSNLDNANKVRDLAYMLEEKKPVISSLSNKVKYLKTAAANMCVSHRFVIATADEVSELSGILSIDPSIGDTRISFLCDIDDDGNVVASSLRGEIVDVEEETSNGWLVRNAYNKAYEVTSDDLSLPLGVTACKNEGKDISIELTTDAFMAIMNILGFGGYDYADEDFGVDAPMTPMTDYDNDVVDIYENPTNEPENVGEAVSDFGQKMVQFNPIQPLEPMQGGPGIKILVPENE